MDVDFKEQAYQLLGIVQAHAPTGEDQQKVAATYNACLAEGHRRALQVMSGVLYDGLTYGNWPWASYRREN